MLCLPARAGVRAAVDVAEVSRRDARVDLGGGGVVLTEQRTVAWNVGKLWWLFVAHDRHRDGGAGVPATPVARNHHHLTRDTCKATHKYA